MYNRNHDEDTCLSLHRHIFVYVCSVTYAYLSWHRQILCMYVCMYVCMLHLLCWLTHMQYMHTRRFCEFVSSSPRIHSFHTQIHTQQIFIRSIIITTVVLISTHLSLCLFFKHTHILIHIYLYTYTCTHILIHTYMHV
jgi:hypothetical protein